jgi:DNA damage-binding protein 1
MVSPTYTELGVVPQRSSRSNLLLLLGHPDPELVFLSYSESETGAGELTARKQLSLHERTPRPAEFFNDVLIHPSGKLAVVSCYTGKLKIIKFKAGNYQEDFDVSCVYYKWSQIAELKVHLFRLPELNVFSVSFLPVLDDEFAIAILYMDYQERTQLIARDILLDDLELSYHPSTVLHATPIAAKVLPCPTECVPQLLSVPPSQPTMDEDGEDEGFAGGVLIVGGKKILLFELASTQGQAKQRGKRRRLEAKKKSTDAAGVEKAREKEMEREGRKRKPRGSVEWPWGEVTAYASMSFLYSIHGPADLILYPGAVLSAHIHSDISLVTRSAGFRCYHLII